MENHWHQMGPWYYLETLLLSQCVCSPTLPQHCAMPSTLTSTLLHSQLMLPPPPPLLHGENRSHRQILLHLTVIQYTTAHIWACLLHLPFNSMEESFFASVKGPPLYLGYRSPPLWLSQEFSSPSSEVCVCVCVRTYVCVYKYIYLLKIFP